MLSELTDHVSWLTRDLYCHFGNWCIHEEERPHYAGHTMQATLTFWTFGIEILYWDTSRIHQEQYRKWCSIDCRPVTIITVIGKMQGWEINPENLIISSCNPLPWHTTSLWLYTDSHIDYSTQAFHPWKSLMLQNCVFLFPSQNKWKQCFKLELHFSVWKTPSWLLFIWSSQHPCKKVSIIEKLDLMSSDFQSLHVR